VIPICKLNNKIFVTGGTGYVGSSLIPKLMAHGFDVTALARKGSESKLPSDCNIVLGNALDRNTFKDFIPGNETFIHLVGVRNPSPKKYEEFKSIDLVSIQEAVEAAKNAGVKHFIYLSVANPAPFKKDYLNIRLEGERLIMMSRMNATFLKPWYIIHPSHKWPYLLLPIYKLFTVIPRTRETALNLALLKLKNVVNAILFAINNPANGIRYMRARQIRKF
jgi:nucleoside-diphosphate-sugar epimerase